MGAQNPKLRKDPSTDPLNCCWIVFRQGRPRQLGASTMTVQRAKKRVLASLRELVAA